MGLHGLFPALWVFAAGRRKPRFNIHSAKIFRGLLVGLPLVLLPRMAADDWLASYAEIESVDAALHGIARRFQRYPRAVVLTDGVQELLINYTALEQHFLDFFPELLGFVATE